MLFYFINKKVLILFCEKAKDQIRVTIFLFFFILFTYIDDIYMHSVYLFRNFDKFLSIHKGHKCLRIATQAP